MSITHRTQAGTATYTDSGILLRSRFGNHVLKLAWSNVDFLCLTPDVQLTVRGWTDFKDNSITNIPFLLIEPALFDRHQIERDGFWRNTWLRQLEIHPLLRADDTPSPTAGYLRIEVKLATLSVARPTFLDYLAACTHFDLIVHT